MRVMIVVTHLLGSGHLSRALVLARAFRDAGDEVLLVSGGMPVAVLQEGWADILQLPPVRSDGVNFSALLDAEGGPVTASTLQARREKLISALTDSRPDALITELFPFGRRNLKDEFLALLAAAADLRPRPLVCTSIRDILAPPDKARKAAFAEETLLRHYDAVLVHSDRSLMPLDASWPVSAELAPLLRYTGFVAPPPATRADTDTGKGEIIVSAGGGAVGQHLFEIARDAARGVPDQTWRLLIGGTDAGPRAAELRQDAPENLVVEPARPDFRALLHNAAASVSLCGYNTALDVLQAGVPAVFVPFDAGSEVEQTIRARQLARQDGLACLTAAELTPATLRDAVQQVTAAPARPKMTEMHGADETVRIVHEMTAGRPG
jgi:predicted glycosyltransferase